MTRDRHAGFTLVEMIVVIVLLGIIGSLGAAFIAKPMEGYIALSNRAELVDAADTALRRIARDVRRALPNSIRVTGSAIELLHTVDGGRYRARVPGDILKFTAADSAFDVLGTLANFTNIAAGSYVVIYNVSSTGASNNAYSGDNRANLDLGASNANFIALSPAFQFPAASPQQRFFVVDSAVTYLCDTGAGTLTRYRYTALSNVQPLNPTVAPLSGNGALLAEHVSACTFTYQAGSSERAGMVTLELVLTADGESVRLLHQVHVDNVP